ncbi:retinal-specific ATP-binding cassette transporter-like isoform X4 [Varroa destructor]|uniref:ABC transporter domain-containing protein n=1 Tax=Varroa destructor TaxID=109461 RepID=A0A7M7KJP6_VARDE|nr:retinal-specific ATP-binding cassette transporter-like isoform X4 [Varroa destructor]
MYILTQLCALLKKDMWILRIKRHPWYSLFELLFPVSVFFVLSIGFKIPEKDPAAGKWYDAMIYPHKGPYSAKHIDFGNSRERFQVIYAPRTDYTAFVIDSVFEIHRNTLVTGFADDNDLEVHLSNINGTVDLAIVFRSVSEPSQLSYTLQYGFKDEIASSDSLSQLAKPRTLRSIFEENLLFPTMYAVFEEHMKFYNLTIASVLDLMRPFPTDRYYLQEGGVPLSAGPLNLIIILGFSMFLCSYTTGVVAQKENRLQEMMRMMGLPGSVYWLNLMLLGNIRGWMIALILTAAMFFKNVFFYSDPSVIILIMMVFTMALVSFALLLTVPFTSPKIMAVVAFVVFIMSLLAINITNGYLDTNTESISDYMSLTIAFKLGTSCVPAMGINWLLKFAMFAEHKGEGLRWHNMLKGVVPGDNIAPIDVVYAMLLSWFLYLAFAVYFDSICPWQSGVPNHPLFFLQPSYWLPVVHDISETTLSSGTKELMEPVSTERRVVIRLWKISHSFGPIRALNDLSFDLYCNEITMLLGHNGAGKTTIMNILTGLILPDHGEVYINGYNVKKNTREARKSIGVCPQHNVLFDDLTVAEHLAFFAKLKDAKADVVKQETEELLLKLNLMHKCGSLSKDLSAEMRRKLCLANALIGGSEILILDEPTTGMDSESRRAVWEILQSERRSRTIVMTTHFMEEADILGDRIVFVAKGRLLACGSPMFLKRKFETGYNLRLGKRFVDVDTSRVVYAMRKALPGYDRISMDMDFGFEFVINIGFPSPQQLVELFRYLEENMTAFGMANLTGDSGRFLVREAFRHPTVIPEGRRLNTVRLCALLRKRWLVTRREWRIVFYVGLVPALATVLYCISTVAVFKNELRRSITYSIPKITSEPIGFVTERQDAVIARFADALKSKHAKVNVIQQSTNISHYLLAMASSDPRSYRNRWVAGGEFDGENRVLWYNGEPYHVGAAALALWQSSILVEATRDPNATVIVTNVYPTKAEEYLLHALFLQTFTRMMAVLFLTFAVSYPACNAVTLPIEERVLKLKLVQIMTGLPRWIYVASNAIFDFCVTLVTATIIVVLIVLMGPPNVFGEMQNLAALIVLLIIYYLAKLPTVYILTYVINDSAKGLLLVQYLTLIPFAFGIGALGIELVLYWYYGPHFFAKLLHITPTFAVIWAIGSISLNGVTKETCKNYDGVHRVTLCKQFQELFRPCCQPCPNGGADICYAGQQNPFAFDFFYGCGYQITWMTMIGLVAWTLLYLLEKYQLRITVFLERAKNTKLRDLKTLWNTEDKEPLGAATVLFGPEDPDVVAERRRVDYATSANRMKDYALVVQNLTKYYGEFLAVNKVSFLVQGKECFGLLGVNGAGKTTTLGMLTNDLLISAGTAYIRDQDVRTNTQWLYEQTGYCPQQNILIDLMTGNEMLRLFCTLRGVAADQTDTIVTHIVSIIELAECADELTQTYSGGTKRKLSFGLAIVGNPSLLLLDEPTTGIDPRARRRIWNTLARFQTEMGSSCLLTSHSMDECEALCQRIAVMVEGSIRCVGSSQHLKTKFSQGFTVLVKLSVDSQLQAKAVIQAMQKLFPSGCRLQQSYQRLLKFHVAKATLRWSAVFERIMQMRNDPTLSIEDVQVSDTSLEEVFLTFARKRDFTLGAITNQRTEDMSKGKPRPSKTDETEWSEAERESTREDRSNSDFPDTVTIEPFLESSSPSTPEDEQLSTSRINEMYSQSPSRLISSGLKEGQSLLTSMEARDMVDNEIKSSSLDIRPPYFRRREPKLKTVHDKKRRPRESTGRSQERHDQDHDSLILHPISPFKINDDDNMRSSLSVKHLPSLSMTQRGSKSFHARSPHLHNTDDAFMDQDTDSSTSSSLLSNNIGQQRTHLPISYGAD